MDIRYLLEILFPYLLILYAADCLSVVRGGHVIFNSRIRRGFALKGPGPALTGILPVSWSVHSRNIPVPVTERGIYIPTSLSHTNPGPWSRDDFLFVPHEDIETVSVEGKRLLINRRWGVPMPTAVAARRLSSFIEDIRTCTRERREDRVRDFEAAAGDLDRARQGLERYREALAPLEFWSSVLFVTLFGFLPVSVYVKLLFPAAVPLAAMILAVYIVVLLKFITAHRRLLPESRGGRLGAVTMMILLPVSASHAVSKMTGGLFSGFDHLTVTALLVPGRLEGLLRRDLVKAQYAAEGGGLEDFTRYWRMRASVMRDLAAAAGVESHRWDRSPERIDKHASCYCPLCGYQYRVGHTVCGDCGICLEAI